MLVWTWVSLVWACVAMACLEPDVSISSSHVALDAVSSFIIWVEIVVTVLAFMSGGQIDLIVCALNWNTVGPVLIRLSHDWAFIAVTKLITDFSIDTGVLDA